MAVYLSCGLCWELQHTHLTGGSEHHASPPGQAGLQTAGGDCRVSWRDKEMGSHPGPRLFVFRCLLDASGKPRKKSRLEGIALLRGCRWDPALSWAPLICCPFSSSLNSRALGFALQSLHLLGGEGALFFTVNASP